MPTTPSQTLNTAVANLQECGPILSVIRLQLDDNWSGSNAALARCENKIDDVRVFVSQACDRLRRLGPELKENEDHLVRRGDAYKLDCSTLQDEVKQLTGNLSQAARRGDDLQQRLEHKQDDLRHARIRITEGEQTIDELKAQLRTANNQIEQLTNAAARQAPPPSPTRLDPSSAGDRPSTDSGFDDGSSAIPADRTRQAIALGLLDTANTEFRRGHYLKADAAFVEVHKMVRQLPSSLQQAFDTSDIAYHRAVCRAEAGTNAEAESKLESFLQSHDKSTRRQRAQITHLLARTHVKLGRLDVALEYSCSAVGQWHEIDPSCDQHFDAVALLVRILHLQVKPLKALAVIDKCPENRKDYVRSKYSNLLSTVAIQATGGRMPPTQPDAPQPGVSDGRPPRLQVPSTARPRPGAGSIVSGTTNTSTASKRAERYKQLPLLFRMALT
ncbi:hypothetical protein LTR97_004937 [Elasticomyces elasticus]|uniref:Uncharacterized protein n=1 Tax=Elasticomyces elasticus TaxID=574655 RepID=A0AAN8A3N4_9PEZI|nr:hypothetical protein LTR97_004937 [Elasticomyces elasticus]